MATNRVGGGSGTNNTQGTSGPNVVRPMYGVFVRDAVEGMRDEITQTMKDTKKAIAAGDPRGTEVRGDGILQGKELKAAKLAVKDMERAIKALKPVNVRAFSGTGSSGRSTGGGSVARGTDGRTVNPAPRPPIAMYGVVLRDDLNKFRSMVSNDISVIKEAIKDPSMPKEAKAEAKKALTALNAALKDLNNARTALR